MVQAHAQQLLNQKESEFDSSFPASGHPLMTATRRLVAALDRLENNLAALSPAQESGEQQQQLLFFEQENNALRQETQQLNAAIAQLQQHYNDLHHVASAIYGKLDDSIQAIDHMMEA